MTFPTDSWTTGGIPKQSTASSPTPNPYAGFGPTNTAGTIQDQAAVLYAMSDAERLAFAKKLNKALYKVKASGAKSNTLAIADALLQAQQDQLVAETRLGKKYASIDEFLAEKQAGDSGVSGTESKAYRTISDPTQAQATINSVMQDVLGRDATKSELSFLTKQLNAKEKAAATVIKDSTGARTQSGGFDPKVFLVNLIQEAPAINKKTGKAPSILSNLNKEFTTKKQSKSSLVSQDILGTVLANGLGKAVSQDQINNWTKRIENGESVDTIKNDIRQIAKMGMPDNVKKLIDSGVDLGSIYSPYKNAMASVLELNPESIDLNDPTLRSAIGANGEVPIYDFQRALRKDARWQYTNNAREEVANSVQRVLKDFGFMG